MEAVKATKDAAGLQCSEVEADSSEQVFTGLQLDHETGMLSLEASRIWRLRRGLEFASRQNVLLVTTWSCLLRRPALSLVNAGYRFCTYLRTSKQTGMARGRPGIPMDRVTTAGSHLQSCQSLVTVGLCCRCLWWGTWGLWSYASLV